VVCQGFTFIQADGHVGIAKINGEKHSSTVFHFWLVVHLFYRQSEMNSLLEPLAKSHYIILNLSLEF
jgi:hypothetical protein